MTYLTKLASPLGSLTLASSGEAVTGVWLEGQKYFAAGLEAETEERPDLPVFHQTAVWLEAYFAKKPLPPLPPLAPQGSAFRQAVWKLLLEIPCGETTTYGALAEKLKAAGVPASPQAVGGHRVVGTDGSLTGYAGGVEKKRFLLELEGADLSRLHPPKKGTAL